LIGLEQRLAAGVGSTEAAQQRAGELIALQDTLNDESLQIAQAKTSVDQLLDMQAKLSGQSERIVAAIESLEVLVGFQDEFATQIQVLGEIRRSLVEFSMLETTVSKAMRMLQPLVELGNLHRLDDQDLRNAARLILEERSFRLGSRTGSDLPASAPVKIEEGAEKSVPLPIDAE